jgi:hypothetical protein
MDENLLKMLNQECPQCKSTSGDIMSYMPIIENNTLEIEIECDNCGCHGKFVGALTTTEFKPNI